MGPITHILEIIDQVIDLIGIAIILWGFGKGVIQLIPIEIRKLKGFDGSKETSRLRISLGTYILMGLEFMIASDIINSLLHPEMENLYILALIVLIRTAIGYFLGKEISELHAEST